MSTLEITWQRLVKDGQTCHRCGATGDAVEAAVATLDQVLSPLGIKPVLRTVEIDDATFEAGPVGSNRIEIAGRSLEDWTGGATGQSQCSSVCGEHQCRTVEVGGIAFDAVPEWLIVKAALLAAADQLHAPCDECGCAGATPVVGRVGLHCSQPPTWTGPAPVLHS